MGLPIHKIIWAPAPLHDNHLHVEGSPRFSGTPPLTNPGRSPAIDVIYKALSAEFGTPYYFTDDPPPGSSWSHMGWYNRRFISGTTVWSQHAYANALDIGPYYGVEEQQVFYDFLTTYQGDDMSEADRMSKGDVNAAIDWNKAFGAMPQNTQRKLMAKLVAIAQNYPEEPAEGNGVPSGTTFTAKVV